MIFLYVDSVILVITFNFSLPNYFRYHAIFGIFKSKELRNCNCNRKSILCPLQKEAEVQPTFYTAIFQNKFTLWHSKLKNYIWKTKFPFHKQYLPDLLFLRNAKKTHTDQSKLQTFSLCLKRNILQTFNRSSCKKVFSKCFYLWYNLLRWMFFYSMW